MSRNGIVRLARLLQAQGVSNKEAETLIKNGFVTVNGEVHRDFCVGSSQVQVEILPQGRELLDRKITILLNKPEGVVAAMPSENEIEALSLLVKRNRWKDDSDARAFTNDVVSGINAADRLEKDSHGKITPFR